MQRDENRIIIDRVYPDETEVLLNLYVDLFYDREPLTKCFGLSRERMIELARSIYLGPNKNPIAQNLCWMARDRFTGNKAVGFIVCDDPAVVGNPPVPDNLKDDDIAKMSVLQALMEAIHKPEQARIGSQAGTCLHIAAIGVASGCEGAGVATRLLKTALAGATAHGFTHAFSECTSIASQRCHEKNGFRNLHCLAVNAFSVNGTFPLSESDVKISLMWKDLGEMVESSSSGQTAIGYKE